MSLIYVFPSSYGHCVVRFSFIIWPLCCLFVFNLLTLVTPLVTYVICLSREGHQRLMIFY